VREWRRLRDMGSAEHGGLVAGGRAFDALMRRGRIAEAREAAAWMVETARSRLAVAPDDPAALRDLSVSLDNVGNTDRALGDWEQARAAFAEGLEIATRLAAALPNHTDYQDLPAWFERRLAELKEAEGSA
jgi:tetratricopeptide (TPR) repeat protein